MATYIVTLDADLQNPPEEIAKIVEAMENGADYVGTVRKDRHDLTGAKVASRLHGQHAMQADRTRFELRTRAACCVATIVRSWTQSTVALK